MTKYALLLVSTMVLAGACTQASEPTDIPTDAGPPTEAPAPTEQLAAPPTEGATMNFEITSEAFAQDEAIPAKFSCDAENVSPPLAWAGAPGGTQSFALIFDDPDAPVGTWVHWVLFDIPVTAASLPEAIAPEPNLSNGSVHGSNSWQSIGYGGPCPPGGTHRYFFKLYALDTVLGLEVGASKEQVLEAMEGHVLDQTELMGTYTR